MPNFPNNPINAGNSSKLVMVAITAAVGGFVAGWFFSNSYNERLAAQASKKSLQNPAGIPLLPLGLAPGNQTTNGVATTERLSGTVGNISKDDFTIKANDGQDDSVTLKVTDKTRFYKVVQLTDAEYKKKVAAQGQSGIPFPTNSISRTSSETTEFSSLSAGDKVDVTAADGVAITVSINE